MPVFLKAVLIFGSCSNQRSGGMVALHSNKDFKVMDHMCCTFTYNVAYRSQKKKMNIKFFLLGKGSPGSLFWGELVVYSAINCQLTFLFIKQ